MKVKSLSHALSDPMDCSLPGSSVPGILQARVLEWGAIAFSLGSTMEVQLFLAGCAAPRPAAARQTHVTRGSYQQSGELYIHTHTHIHAHIYTHVLYAHIYRYIYTHTYIHTYQRRQWHPTPVLLPGKFHGQRSLVGCSPWGR